MSDGESKESDAVMSIPVRVEAAKPGSHRIRLYGSEIRFTVNEQSEEPTFGAAFMAVGPPALAVEYGGKLYSMLVSDFARAAVDRSISGVVEENRHGPPREEPRPPAAESIVLELVRAMRENPRLASALKGTPLEFDVLRLAAELDIENKGTTNDYIKQYVSGRDKTSR